MQIRRVGVLLLALMLAGCATLQMQTPDVLLAGVKMLPSEGMAPRFEVRLRLVNPNENPLKFKGGSFRLYLQDTRIASGVINNPDPVPAFGESELVATASGDVLGGISLVRKLMGGNPESFEYRIDISLSREGSLLPLTATRSGRFDLEDVAPK